LLKFGSGWYAISWKYVNGGSAFNEDKNVKFRDARVGGQMRRAASLILDK
jgi:hypothetical protein